MWSSICISRILIILPANVPLLKRASGLYILLTGFSPLSAPPIAVDPEVTNGFPSQEFMAGEIQQEAEIPHTILQTDGKALLIWCAAKLDLANSIPLDYYHVR